LTVSDDIKKGNRSSKVFKHFLIIKSMPTGKESPGRTGERLHCTMTDRYYNEESKTISAMEVVSIHQQKYIPLKARAGITDQTDYNTSLS
jgi:hypothetical protein